MAQDEYEQTAFYIAMNNEDEDNDDFEDRPHPVVRKKQRRAPMKRPSPPQISPSPAPHSPWQPKTPPGRRITTPPSRARHSTPSDYGRSYEHRPSRSPTRFLVGGYGEVETFEEEIDPFADAEEVDERNPVSHEQRRKQTKPRSNADWQDEEDGADWLEKHDRSPSGIVKTEREGTAGLAANRDPNEDGGQDGAGEDGAGEDGAGEDGAGEDGAGEDGAGKDGAGEDGGDEDGGEDGAGEDGAAAEPDISIAHANDQEDARDGNSSADAVKKGSKAGSPVVGSQTATSLGAQLAEMLAAGVTDDELQPHDHALLAAALAHYTEKAKEKNRQEKLKRNREKMLLKKIGPRPA